MRPMETPDPWPLWLAKQHRRSLSTKPSSTVSRPLTREGSPTARRPGCSTAVAVAWDGGSQA